MGDVTDVTIDTVTTDFHTNEPGNGRTVGVCIAFDRGTNGVTVRNVSCKNTWRGVVVMVGTTLPYMSPKLSGIGVRNIYVSNLTFEGDFGTGFTNELSTDPITNVTWDGVTILKGGAAEGNRCYNRCACVSRWYTVCQSSDWKQPFENVRFRNFRGALGDMPAPGWGCAANQTKCDIEFEGWAPTIP
ncbi:hypothetical protein CC78DRAFT_530122 [Lojkania enalia]|uniref:Pectin lyase-like protein n=1 Tax=Lojkania enalia TaxID=147567 RepID=A0A9P4KFH6_9PLEO|nr:hypothetical protein CC78DRAFT_530122 [Didymosphaeria enalia]